MKGVVLGVTTNYDELGQAVHSYLVKTIDEAAFWQGYLKEKDIKKALKQF